MRDIARTSRWLALPAAVLLLAMVGMALSADPEPDSQDADNLNQPTEIEQREIEDDLTPTGDDGDTDTVQAPSVTISTADGEVEIRFDPDGVARASAGGQDGEFDLVQGTESGIRVGDDGRLEPVPPGQIGPDDVGFTPTPSGVDVQAPGTNTVELRPDGVTGGVSATEFDGENAVALTPDDGIVELDDGTTISPIEPPSVGFIQAESSQLPWRWIFTTIASLAVMSAATGFLLHRSYAEHDLAVLEVPTTTGIDENYEQFFSRLDADPDPTRAIRVGFHALEQGFGGLPTRLDSETPFEWHQRVSMTIPTADEPLRRICDLFAKARFAPDDATSQDRRQMIDELRAILTEVHPPRPNDPALSAP